MIYRMDNPPALRGKILFINALNEVTRQRAFSYLTDDHINNILTTYQDLTETDGFSRIVDLDEIKSNAYSLSIPLYVREATNKGPQKSLPEVIADWETSSDTLRISMDDLFTTLEEAGFDA